MVPSQLKKMKHAKPSAKFSKGKWTGIAKLKKFIHRPTSVSPKECRLASTTYSQRKKRPSFLKTTRYPIPLFLVSATNCWKNTRMTIGFPIFQDAISNREPATPITHIVFALYIVFGVGRHGQGHGIISTWEWKIGRTKRRIISSTTGFTREGTKRACEKCLIFTVTTRTHGLGTINGSIPAWGTGDFRSCPPAT